MLRSRFCIKGKQTPLQIQVTRLNKYVISKMFLRECRTILSKSRPAKQTAEMSARAPSASKNAEKRVFQTVPYRAGKKQLFTVAPYRHTAARKLTETTCFHTVAYRRVLDDSNGAFPYRPYRSTFRVGKAIRVIHMRYITLRGRMRNV